MPHINIKTATTASPDEAVYRGKCVYGKYIALCKRMCVCVYVSVCMVSVLWPFANAWRRWKECRGNVSSFFFYLRYASLICMYTYWAAARTCTMIEFLFLICFSVVSTTHMTPWITFFAIRDSNSDQPSMVKEVWSVILIRIKFRWGQQKKFRATCWYFRKLISLVLT